MSTQSPAANPYIDLIQKADRPVTEREERAYNTIATTRIKWSFVADLVKKRILATIGAADPGSWEPTVWAQSKDGGKYGHHGIFEEAFKDDILEVARHAGLIPGDSPDADSEILEIIDRGWDMGEMEGLTTDELEGLGLLPLTYPEKATEAAVSDSEDVVEDLVQGSLSDRLTQSIVNWDEAFSFDPSSVKFLPGGFAREGDYLTLIGDAKVGKTVFSHDWAWRMATGQDFLGSGTGESLPVLYLDKENPIQVYVDHFRSYGATPSTMGDLTFMSYPDIPPLDTAQGGKVFVELVKLSGAKVVFLDTISRFVQGAENENDTWLNVYRYCIVPLRGYDPSVTVIRLDHFGKDKSKGGRGGSAKEGDVDGVYELKKENGSSYKLERTHTRTGIGPEEIRFTRSGRVVDNQWAPGETAHVLIPEWKVAGPSKTGETDFTSVAAMADYLDTECVPDGPDGWGLNRAVDKLREKGFKGSTATLRDVQKQRQARDDYSMKCPDTCEHRNN